LNDFTYPFKGTTRFVVAGFAAAIGATISAAVCLAVTHWQAAAALIGGLTATAIATHHFISIKHVRRLERPDLNQDGTVHGTYSIANTISEFQKAEEKLQQVQRLESVGRLTGGIAHDVNNMLAIISGNIELACEDIVRGKDPRKRLQTALRATERGSILTQSLLSFARQQPLAPSKINLNDFVREAIEFNQHTVPENIDIRLISDTNLRPCEADAGQLQNALLKLIVNAIDAMPNGGKLTIKTGNEKFSGFHAAKNDIKPGEYAALSVTDTGTGMPSAVIVRAFEPFFTTKPVGKGTGLGLSMVYGFAKQSRGHIKIESEPGKGTTVKLYLPAAQAVKDTLDRAMNGVFENEAVNG
jgi:signal transduction histidine kinase